MIETSVSYGAMHVPDDPEIKRLQDENDRLREALESIAEDYDFHHKQGLLVDRSSAYAETARTALQAD